MINFAILDFIDRLTLCIIKPKRKMPFPINVKQGQKIKQGELLGLCGNSGNSSEPHLHFHIQNVENMNNATGVKCYFEEFYVDGKLKKRLFTNTK